MSLNPAIPPAAKAARSFRYIERDSLTSFNDFGLAEPILRALARREIRHSHPDPGPDHSARCCKAATSSASRRPAPARPPPSRCRSSIICSTSVSARAEDLPRAGASPTRELSGQILDSFRAYGRHIRPLEIALAIGGVPIDRQVRALSHGVDVLVATPGRLLDLVQQPCVAPRPGRSAGARRSRPHARHGLHPRHPEDRRDAAENAADAVVLGHHAAGDRRARRRRCCGIRRAWR